MSITDFIAILALILSGISLYIQWREKRISLKVKISKEKDTMFVLYPDYEEKITEKYFEIHLSNDSERAIAIKSISLFVKPDIEFGLTTLNIEGDYRDILYGGEPLPFVVEPQRGYSLSVYGPELNEKFTKRKISGETTIRALVSDEIHRVYKSNKIKFRLESMVTESEKLPKQKK